MTEPYSSEKPFNPFWDSLSLQCKQFTPPTGAEAVRQAIRRIRWRIGSLSSSSFQPLVDEAWEAWREHLPYELLPPKRPIVGGDDQAVHDALDELQRKLNRLFPPTPSAQEERSGAGTDPAKGEQAEATDEKARQEAIAKLSPAVRKAYLSFEAARLKAEKKDMKDWEAYNLLKEKGIPEDGKGELTDYQLPAKDTWTRYLRIARQALGGQKSAPAEGGNTARALSGAIKSRCQSTTMSSAGAPLSNS
jgi:hypothetical protein